MRADSRQGPLLVEHLHEAGMVGLGMAMAPYWTDVPEAMIEAADRLSFPVLRISGGIPFHELVTHIHLALASEHTHMLQRIVSIQAALAGLLTKDRRPQAVTQFLGPARYRGAVL